MTALTGPRLALLDDLDQRFAEVAGRWNPARLRFPPVIGVEALERIDYFRSFPHLFTAAVSLADDADSLASFAAGEPVSDGALQLGPLAPVRHVLTPATCYPLYEHLSGTRVSQRQHFTMVGTCFRREAQYVEWERQWCFTMREVVCVGASADVADFLEQARAAASALAADFGLTATWQLATDPFFQPSRNPKYLMQRVDPTKHELVFDGRLAIASVNLHHDHFGRAFDIATVADEDTNSPAHTACLAFGVERWVAAIVQQHGADAAGWPAAAR